MKQVDEDTLLKKLISHVEDQKQRAKLGSEPFDLGIATDTRPSPVLTLVRDNQATFTSLGMKNYVWHDDALRSKLNLGGEELFISICRSR